MGIETTARLTAGPSTGKDPHTAAVCASELTFSQLKHSEGAVNHVEPEGTTT